MMDGWKRRMLSFKYAFQGLAHLVRTQPNAQIHLAIASLVLLAGAWLGLNRMEWGLLVLATVLVLGAEALNTALEALTDLVSPDYHPLAGRAKDVAAGGVLVCAIGAAIVGLIVFLPHIWALLSN